MNCKEFDDLSAAYALGAVSPEEHAAAEAHLRGCDRHSEVAELFAVAATLAVAVPEKEPPPALKARLMDAIRPDVTPVRAPASAPRRGLLDSIRSWFSGARAGYAMSGAMAVLVAALLVWNISLQSSDDDGAGQVVVQLSGAAQGRVMYLPDEHMAVMDMSGLPALPDDQTYQVWAISGGQPVSLGLMSPDPSGHTTAAMTDVDLSDVDTLAVTVEPAAGSDQPTSDPIITGDL